jgi:hypothetical protein
MELESEPKAPMSFSGIAKGKLDIGTEWNVDQYADVELGLGVGVTFQNEGITSAIVRIEASSDDRVRIDGYSPHNRVSSPRFMSPVTDIHGWSILGPGERASLHWTWWRTTREWSTDFSNGVVSKCSVLLAAQDGLGTVRDTCRLTFGASIVAKSPAQNKWVVVGAKPMTGVIPDLPQPFYDFTFVERVYSVPASRTGGFRSRFSKKHANEMRRFPRSSLVEDSPTVDHRT